MTRAFVPRPAAAPAKKSGGETRPSTGPSPLAVPAFSLAQIAIAPSHAVIQARWMPGPGAGQVHWVGRSDEASRPPPPDGMEVVDVPLETGVEMGTASGHRSMRGLYTQPDSPTAGLDMLAHAAALAQQNRGLAYSGPTEQRGLGPQPVLATIPHRDPGAHRTIFSQNSGYSSATAYNNSLGLGLPGTNYQIGHGMGHGQGGAATQDINNLATISQGANGEMIPFDNAISGNTDVVVNTSFNMRPGTHRAESVHQSFAHRDYPDDPFHDRMIDADRPLPSSSEWDSFHHQASRFAPDALDAAATMISMTRPRASDAQAQQAPRQLGRDEDEMDDRE
ncbi:MAG: hypothetical protein E7773_07920 [Sphingomonas sp.]|uniref:hypothetical protein n=1 Tax=Sphingomonas sp. TaxID=28214 RepID=UPI0011F78D51|nr:hypothetical protein [Sphingomonas sp.]THD35867.1 MAG: hypothetical protein E7773_07920 [Sphingomonas sp.]